MFLHGIWHMKPNTHSHHCWNNMNMTWMYQRWLQSSHEILLLVYLMLTVLCYTVWTQHCQLVILALVLTHFDDNNLWYMLQKLLVSHCFWAITLEQFVAWQISYIEHRSILFPLAETTHRIDIILLSLFLW